LRERRLFGSAFLAHRPNVATDIALADGAASIYVSATPTASAVGFYLRQGCRLAHPVHPDLFAAEPEDIHLVRSLA
jgi:hypothetical protein